MVIESLRFTRCSKRQRKRNGDIIESFCASSSRQNDFKCISHFGVRVAHWR